mgnify:FL=1
MKRAIFEIISVILGSWAFAYDFKTANTEGAEICYNILADSTSVEVTYDNAAYGEFNYNNLTCDTLHIPESVMYNDMEYSVVRLGERAFNNMTPTVKTIVIPKTIKYIKYTGTGVNQQVSKMTFIENNLESIIVSDENLHFMSKKGILYTHNGDTLIAYPTRNNQDSVFLDEGLTYFAPGAMENALNIEYLELPLSLKKIDSWALCDMNNLKHLVIKDNVDTLGANSISCLGLTHLTLGSGLKYVDARFVETDSVLHLYCRAINPPAIRNNSHNLFKYVPEESFLYVPAKSISIYRNTPGWNALTNIFPIEPPIVASSNEATVSWVQNFSATGYVWHLYSDAEHTQLVMSLTFDERGYLTELTLGDGLPATAAEHNRAAAPMRGTDGDNENDGNERRFAEYYSFTIRSLSPDRQYYYVRQALSGEEIIDEEQGSFETLTDTETGLDERAATEDIGVSAGSKLLREGRVLIVAPDGSTYTPDGKELK